MIYESEYIYTQLKEIPDISSEEEFIKYLKDNDVNDERLLESFSNLRLGLGESFKLDNFSFLFGNGCSVYAGSKSTLDFRIKDVIVNNEFEDIEDVLHSISNLGMESQLNALITIRDYYQLTSDSKKASKVAKLIAQVKNILLNDFVNSIDYSKLSYHAMFLLKLRAFGCLSKVKIYTTNYDLAFEYMLDKLSIEYSNGFSGFVNRKFDPKALQNKELTELIKVHGSVNWFYDEYDNVIKEFQPRFINNQVVIDESKQVLIYPTSEKLYQTYNEPYSELMRNMLNNFESNRNVIIVLGYKYGDEHINDILYKAVANPNNIFYFFDYNNDNCDFIKKMKSLSNDIHNINILCGKFLASFETFVKYILPATAEKTDQERALELLQKVLNEHEK